MIPDAARALGQMGDPRFQRVLLMGVAASVALLAGFAALAIWGAAALVGPSVTLPWLGPVTWLDNAAGWALVPVMLVASVVLMVPVASAFTGLMLDRIAEAEGFSTPGFISKLHAEVLELRGETRNFTSLLRCACLQHLRREAGLLPEPAIAAEAPGAMS